jgi:small multidrug resistance pump
MEWVFLGFAILFEITGTVCLKLSEGFSRLAPTLVIFPAYAVSFTFLALAVKVLPISVAYAIWSGVGTAVIALIGILWLREPASIAKLLCIALVIAGVVGLHLVERAGGSE